MGKIFLGVLFWSFALWTPLRPVIVLNSTFGKICIYLQHMHTDMGGRKKKIRKYTLETGFCCEVSGQLLHSISYGLSQKYTCDNVINDSIILVQESLDGFFFIQIASIS